MNPNQNRVTEPTWLHEKSDDVRDALNLLAKEAYECAKSKGFHDKPNSVGDYCANLHGEVSELWEAYRKGTLHEPCDKPIRLTCLEEELADIVIRAVDMAHALNVDIGDAVLRKYEYNLTRERMHGGKVA